MSTSFATYLEQGEALEGLVEGLLKDAGRPYRRNEVGPGGDLSAQHMGDFKIGRNLYLECKNDAMFSKTGNLYLEIGEIRTEDSPKDARTIQPVGALKHAAKAPTIVVHQVAEDGFYVYSVRQALSAISAERAGIRWNERADSKAGRRDKVNLGMLWMGAEASKDGKLRAVFRRCTSSGILEAVELAKAMELSYQEDEAPTIVDLARNWGRVSEWRLKGWHRYAVKMPS